jgi:metallo-beta-lactamase class B
VVPRTPIIPIARVGNVSTIKDGKTVRAGGLSLTAHFTAGHTPGGTSWTWQSCENNRCLNLVYSDSLTPVSSDDFFYTRSKLYSTGVADFEHSYAFLEKTPCDILITPHPDFSNLWQRLERRSSNPDALIDTHACQALAKSSRESLKERIAEEKRTRPDIIAR